MLLGGFQHSLPKTQDIVKTQGFFYKEEQLLKGYQPSVARLGRVQ